MRGPLRVARHRPVLAGRDSSGPTSEDAENDERFVDRPCYRFNSALHGHLNDRRCAHCRHYLTARCPHIDEFLDDVDDLSPE